MSKFEESVKETLGGCLVLIVLGVIGLIGLKVFLNHRDQKEAEMVQKLDYSKPSRKYTDVQKIWDEKESNSVNFMSSVNNQMVYVTGRITKDGINSERVLVGEEYPNPYAFSPYLSCNVRNKDVLPDLKSGMMVKVAGLMDFDDGLMESIDINHCFIKRL